MESDDDIMPTNAPLYMSNIREELEALGMWPAPYGLYGSEQSPASTTKKDRERKGNKDASLGDINPLIKTIDFSNRGVVDTNIQVTRNLIEERGGVVPEFMNMVTVYSPPLKRTFPRFIARFIVDDLPEAKIGLLEGLVKDTYRLPVRTRKSTDGKDIDPNDERYPQLRKGDSNYRNTSGWYMGTGDRPTDPAFTGLYVFRDSGEVTRSNFSKKQTTEDSRFIVEVREGELYQTEMVEFITQVSTILASDKAEPRGALSYKIYYDLMRHGMRLTSEGSIHGMDKVLNEIRRRLVKPLANLDLSSGIETQPESVLLVGVPGTGKTLAAKKLLDEDTGVFILPVTTKTLYEEMRLPVEKQTLFPRIDEVSATTGRRVILHVDDIEEISKSEQGQSNFQNLMAGVRDRGFYLIASTNEPEQMEEALLQPQRLAVLIHCGLQDKEARQEILKIHAPERTRVRGLPLFDSGEERELILEEIAEHTQNYTPRYLAQIGTIAKSHLLNRVSTRLSRNHGLTEDNLGENDRFVWSDWESALAEVAQKYDAEGMKRRDEFLRNFVIKANRNQPGFINSGRGTTIFSAEFHEKLAKLKKAKD